jgi:hypothetical protein
MVVRGACPDCARPQIDLGAGQKGIDPDINGETTLTRARIRPSVVHSFFQGTPDFLPVGLGLGQADQTVLVLGAFDENVELVPDLECPGPFSHVHP